MGPAGFQGIVVARVGYRSAARMFVVSEDDTYSGYGLEQLSQVFTVKEHRQLAASDVRDWLIAVGKALQKRRLIEKANAWARFVTGDYGADTSSDFAAMGIAELQTAGMPLADAKLKMRRWCIRVSTEDESRTETVCSILESRQRLTPEAPMRRRVYRK